MELNICHLYPDLLNTYGDFGNVLILKYRCEKRNIKITIINVSLKDEFEENKYDIVFFGGGQDFEQTIVSEDLLLKKEKIIRYIENNGVFLAICGGYQLLGQYYKKDDGEIIKGIGALNIHTESGKKRLIGDTLSKHIKTGETIVGFENHFGKTYLGDDVKPLSEVKNGFGNNGEDGLEGATYKNTVATYSHGSFLSKNPKIADDLIKKALLKKYGEIELDKIDDKMEYLAKNHIIKHIKES